MLRPCFLDMLPVSGHLIPAACTAHPASETWPGSAQTNQLHRKDCWAAPVVGLNFPVVSEAEWAVRVATLEAGNSSAELCYG